MIKRILSSKTKLGIAIIIILMLVMGLSYGTFLITTDNYKVSELLIAELNYGINIEADEGSTCSVDGTKVTTPQDTECFITIQISSVNPIDSRYALAYKNLEGSAEVEYTDKTQWTSEGLIDGYTEDTTYTRKVRVVIDNIGKNSESITDFKVFGGYTFNSNLSIKLKDNYQTIPGTYTESEEAGNQRLVDIVEKDTDCITSESNECLYGGGVITNYLQYPTPADGNTNDNLWRITGSYSIDGKDYAKVVYNSNKGNTTQENIKSTLNSFYKTLDKASEIIEDTNKFNCTKDGCTASNYDKIGLLSTYEYVEIGGQESYLGISDSWFALENSSIKNITTKGIEEVSGESGIRPTAYLQTDVTVTGKGTIDDPYRISPKGDINIVAWTLNGEPTTEDFETLLNSSDKTIGSVTCKNGTEAKWVSSSKSINLSNIQAPDYCTINFIDYKEPPFIAKLLENNSVIKTREDFTKPFSEAGLYQETNIGYLEEDGRTRDAVYYFAGDVKNNWVKFGQESGQDIWWRIIRTNEDGSVRLLYAGKGATGYNTTSGYIGVYKSYNSSENSPEYVGYMYGSSGSLANIRQYTKSSTIKTEIDKWYNTNLFEKSDGKEHNWSDYVSKTAIYCNDRTTRTYSSSTMYYGASKRLTIDAKDSLYGGATTASEYHPTYKCGGNTKGTELLENADIADKFTSKNQKGEKKVGNQQLDYPVALITADEIVYAGGSDNSENANVYYYKNNNGTSITDQYAWWTMSPYGFMDHSRIFSVEGLRDAGSLGSYSVSGSYHSIRPVLSLKSCVGITGAGTTSDPYIPSVDAACAQADN